MLEIVVLELLQPTSEAYLLREANLRFVAKEGFSSFNWYEERKTFLES